MADILARMTGDATTRAQGKRDIITRILNQRSSGPTNEDVAETGTARMLGVINPQRFKDPGTVQDVSNRNTQAELQPQMGELEMLTKAADAGHADSKNILETFKNFAPDPDQLSTLVQAASADPEEITAANAAQFAARKSQELGLGAGSLADSRRSKNPSSAAPQNLPQVDEQGVLIPAKDNVASLEVAPIDTKGLGRPPAGFMWARGPNGDVRQVAVPGGPSDPTRQKGKATLTMPEQTKLSNMGTNLMNLERITNTFSPDYTGYLPGTGAPSVLAKGWGWAGDAGITEADWWQDYQGFVNQVRHDQFGSALTATEKAEFEKAMVTKNTDPRLAKRNLARQTMIAHNAGLRFAKSLIAGGKNPDQVTVQTGIPIEEIEAFGGAPAGKLQTVKTPEEAAKLPKGTRFLDPNGVERMVP